MQCVSHSHVVRAMRPCSSRISTLAPRTHLQHASKCLVRAQPEAPPTAESTYEEGQQLSGDYCSLDSAGKRVKQENRTVGELEQEFLEAMSDYYYADKPKLTDEEFELLKEELLWAGSKVAILDSNEQRFLEATQAYQKAILSDEEYDSLKAELKLKSSAVAAQGPRCSIRSKKMYSDAYPEYLRMTALNLPAALLVLGFLFSLDDLTGFEVTSLLELPPPGGIIVLWAVVLPLLYLLSTSITNLVLRDHSILKGPCPNCGTDNFTYFGDILTVSGNRGSNLVECSSCKADLTYDMNKRVIVVDTMPEEKAQAMAAAAAKKAASAAKKAAAAAKKAANKA